MMSPGVEVNTTIKSSDGLVRYAFDLDVDYITERIIAMSFPSGGPEAQYRSNLKDVVNMLKTKHQNHYVIFNLSKRRNDIIKMNDQVLDVGWHDSLAPPLERLCSICKQIETWLRKDPHNVAVLHCKGSRSPIGVVILAYMNYISITANSESSLDRYAMKRFMEAKTERYMQPSQYRYEGYFTGLLTGAISINSSPLYLHHIVIHGVPNYDANGGCRPFIRIYQGMQMVYTSGVYTVPEGTTKFVISLDKALPMRGDILVKCYHKKFRSNTRDVIFRCQFHTTAVVEYRLLFGKEDLDDSCTDARFPPFSKVEFIFSSTGDRLHNSDYVSHSNFPIDNSDDPLIRWDSYENFSKLVEGYDADLDTPQPNGGNNNNLPPGSTKYIYASDGSPYAQVQKPPSFNDPLVQSHQPQQQQQSAPPSMHTNGPTRQNTQQNGPTSGPTAHNGPTSVPPNVGPPGRGVERSASGRQMDFKEQRQLEELLRGIEEPKGLDSSTDNNPVPGSLQKSPMAESPGNRRIVSVHAELKNVPLSAKKATPPPRPIVEEEFENSPSAQAEESKPPATAPPLVTAETRVEEETIAPERVAPVRSPPPFTSPQSSSADVPSSSNPMHRLPNGSAMKDNVPFEHANPTYDYTERGRSNPHRTGGEVEEPITEVRLKASPVNIHSLESAPPRTDQFSSSMRSPKGAYEPQPLRAQQQKIKFITKYEDEPDRPDRRPGPPQGVSEAPDDGQLWLKRQPDRVREDSDRPIHDRYQQSRYPYSPQTDRYPIQEPGVQSSYQSNVHHAPPRVGSYNPTYPMSGPHSPGSSVKSEPVTSGRVYPPDNLSWLEQQQMKLRERRNRERLGMDPSRPLQVDTSYTTAQLPSQPSSISSVRSDVSGFSNTPYQQQRLPDSMASRRGFNPAEPLSVSQPPPRRGPPTPAYGYDNTRTTPTGQGAPLVDQGPSRQDPQQTPKRSQSLTRERPDGTRLFIDEPAASRTAGRVQEAEANTNNSANVYNPNRYAPSTELPSGRPVERSDSLGGYESDSAIQCKPSKLRPGEAELWIQNPGGLPSQESEHWNRIEGLHLPEERSPNYMHSSNESLPNGGTTPKFPVGPNMVQTCIAVVGRPPHGPDEPIPLSPTGRQSNNVLETSLPRYPEPARKPLQTSPSQQAPLHVRPLEPVTSPTQERTLQVRPLEPAHGQRYESKPDYTRQLNSGPSPSGRVPYKRGPSGEDRIDVDALEALLESVSPMEAKGGVPERPTGPGSYMGERTPSGKPGARLRYEPAPAAVPGESRSYPSSARDTQSVQYHTGPTQPVDRIKPSLVEEALSTPRRTGPSHYQTQPQEPVQHDVWVKATTADQAQSVPQQAPRHRQGQVPYQPSQPYSQVPRDERTPQQPIVEEPISKTELSPTKVVIQDLPAHAPHHTPPPSTHWGTTAGPQRGTENRQRMDTPSSQDRSPHQPIQGYSGPQTPSDSSRSPSAQHVEPQYMQQPQRAVVDRQQQPEQYSPTHAPRQERIQPQMISHQYSAPTQERSYPQSSSYRQEPTSQRVYPQEMRQEAKPRYPLDERQDSRQNLASYQPQPAAYQPGSQQQQPISQNHPLDYQYQRPVENRQEPMVKQSQPQTPQHQRPMVQSYQQPIAHKHMAQRPMDQPYQPMAQQQRSVVQQSQPHHPDPESYQQHPYGHSPQQPMVQPLVQASYHANQQPMYQQREQVPQSPGSEPPSISFSEATPPPKHIGELESPIFQQKRGGEESGRGPLEMEPSGAPPPVHPTYSDHSKNRPQPLYPTFSDRHRRAHPRMDEAFAGQNGNYRTLYDNRNASNLGRGSSESDGSAVSPGTTSPVRQAVSPAGPSPSPSGRSTPSNFYLMPHNSPYGSNNSLADPNKEHVRFVKDLSSWWYKPHATREEAINLLRDKPPGTFVVRDSNSFPGAFGLAIKVSQPPPNAPPRKAGDPANELIRHFLIEPNTRGVRLKGCANEPVFGSLSALIYQHTLTQLALPCKLVLPDIDPAGVDSPDAIDPKSAAALLKQGAACNVLYLQTMDMESLTGPSAVREAITRVMNLKEKPKAVKVHLKVSLKGMTVTDKARKLFFRKHFPVESILYCGMDPGSRKVPRMEGQETPDAKCFGVVCRKPGSLTDNQCIVFSEYEVEQPAAAIVSFVTKVLLGSKEAKSP